MLPFFEVRHQKQLEAIISSLGSKAGLRALHEQTFGQAK